MSTAEYHALPRPDRAERLRHQLRVLRVLASIDFKLKYAESAMGYLWSIIKPLSYFAVLWVVFGRFFRVSASIEEYGLYLLIGIVLYTFFVDATGLAFPSMVKGGNVLRKLAFPPLVLPIAATVTAAITFMVNLAVVAVFIAASRVTPSLDWLAIPLLLIELYLFTLGLGLILATFFVRFHDIAQIWELGAQLLIFAAPVMYPITILPEWAQRFAYLNPLVQVMQDVRAVTIGTALPEDTVAGVLGGSAGRLVPVTIALATFALGLFLFRRESPRFAERA
jgi:ABC-2 type transport system permease protein